MKWDPQALAIANLIMDMADKMMKYDEEEADKLMEASLEIIHEAIQKESNLV